MSKRIAAYLAAAACVAVLWGAPALPAQAAARVEKAVSVGEEPVAPPPLIYEKEETT